MFPLAIPLILGGASFLGGLFGKKQSQHTQSSGTSNSTSSTMPQWDAQFGGLRDTIMPIIQKRLTDPTSFSKQLTERGISDINRTYDLAEQGLGNRLTSRGLGGSNVAKAGIGDLSGGRAGDIVSLLRDQPLIERQMQDSDMQFASNLLGMGRGMQSTGQNSYTGTSDMTGSSGGGVGGGLQSMMSMLAYLYGNGAFGGGGRGALPSTGFPPSPYPTAPPMSSPYGY